jgi:hypothetical protein
VNWPELGLAGLEDWSRDWPGGGLELGLAWRRTGAGTGLEEDWSRDWPGGGLEPGLAWRRTGAGTC